MATTKEVKVIINGEETVSGAASGAEGALSKLTSKIPGWAQAVAAITAAYAVLSRAIGAAKDFVIDSFDAYDAFAASQTRLAAQSKLTGVAMDDLRAAARRAREEFGLSTTVANDAAVTTAKYAARAGDATLQNKLLAAALDLGAASGLDAAASMEALEQGLRGQDEGFDKLLGKNPSTIWKEYADANDLAVGKMSDMQKRMAELTAVVEAGNLVVGSYSERLETGAGRTRALGDKVDQLKVAFGAALQPIRVVVINGLIAMLNVLSPLIVGIGRAVNIIAVSLVGAFVLLQSAIGSVAEGIGKLTGNKSLENWGDAWARKFPAYIEQVTKSAKGLDDMGAAATQAGRAHELAAIKIVANAGDSAEAIDQSATRMMTALSGKLGPSLAHTIGITEGAIRSLSASARDQLPPETAQKFKDHMASIAAHARDVEAKFTSTTPKVESSSRSAKEMADGIATVARGALDAAQAFGVIDQNAASALGSAINIADSIGKIAGGNVFAGVAGLMGGVANIVSVMMAGDRERRELTRKNTEALDKLRRDGVRLSSEASGDQIAGITGALSPQLVAALSNMTDPTSRAAGNQILVQALAKAGLRLSDLDAVASDLGMNLRRENGQIDLSQLPLFLAALQENGRQLTTIGQSFSDQLNFFRETQDLTGASGAGAVNGLLDFLRNVGGVSVLDGLDASDPEALRQQLLNLFTQLNNGGLDPSQLGDLTGEQFRDILAELIRSVTALTETDPPTTGGSGTGSSSGTGTTGGEDGGVPGGDGASIPLVTLQTVVDTMLAQTEALGAFHVTTLEFQARTADATEATAANTALLIEGVERLVSVSVEAATQEAEYARAQLAQLADLRVETQSSREGDVARRTSGRVIR